MDPGTPLETCILYSLRKATAKNARPAQIPTVSTFPPPPRPVWHSHNHLLPFERTGTETRHGPQAPHLETPPCGVVVGIQGKARSGHTSITPGTSSSDAGQCRKAAHTRDRTETEQRTRAPCCWDGGCCPDPGDEQGACWGHMAESQKKQGGRKWGTSGTASYPAGKRFSWQ